MYHISQEFKQTMIVKKVVCTSDNNMISFKLLHVYVRITNTLGTNIGHIGMNVYSMQGRLAKYVIVHSYTKLMFSLELVLTTSQPRAMVDADQVD